MSGMLFGQYIQITIIQGSWNPVHPNILNWSINFELILYIVKMSALWTDVQMFGNKT